MTTKFFFSSLVSPFGLVQKGSCLGRPVLSICLLFELF
ncbi:hypothetical protein QY97_01688 [Bacillus thermotolerans]|nr:hypothetical protein QY97_01688 [Bacillus thermotolerans]